MSFIRQRWQLLLVILTGWVNRQQQAVERLGKGPGKVNSKPR